MYRRIKGTQSNGTLKETLAVRHKIRRNLPNLGKLITAVFLRTFFSPPRSPRGPDVNLREDESEAEAVQSWWIEEF